MARGRFLNDVAGAGWFRRLFGRAVASVPPLDEVRGASGTQPGVPAWAGLEPSERAEWQRVLTESRVRLVGLDGRRTAVYRLFDAAGALLYVGISVDPKKRFKNHRYGTGKTPPQEWWPEVAVARIEWLASRPEAETAEAFAIVTEHPRHNRAMTGEWAAGRFRHRWLEERLAGQRRPGPDDGAIAWRAWHALTGEIQGHDVPSESWWSPSGRCDRLLARQHANAAERGLTIREHVPWLLRVEEVVRLTRHHQGECERCQQPYPCAVIQAVADRFTDDPQHALLWG